jgi:type IV pilus modification protein PilV
MTTGRPDPQTAMQANPNAARCRRPDAGFTMIEVMLAMLVATVGLLGTVAVQQTMLVATAHANDGAIAQRLASQAIEELSARQLMPGLDQMAAVANNTWSAFANLDAMGRPADVASPAARWQRRTRVSNLGTGLPYNISVQVRYSREGGNPKVVQLDMERRK